MPLLSRLALAWSLFFRIFFDGRKAAAIASRLSASPDQEPDSLAEAPKPAEDRVDSVVERQAGATLLLGLLQQEGRLVDFLQQELTGFEDADIGVVARSVHEGCRKVLSANMSIKPIRDEPEGQSLTLPVGFDADSVKLTGGVTGAAPFTGILRHRGWRAENVSLPVESSAARAAVLCQAEVEL